MSTELTTAAPWRSRIVDHADVSPAELLDNPRNWRQHPKAQADALADALDSVGFVTSVIVNRTSGRLVDGHLRVKLARERGEPTVPVDYVELTDDEESLVLATLDPLAAMAETNAAALSSLLDGMTHRMGALGALLSGLSSSITPTLPTPREQREPVLQSECLIEIRCTTADRDAFAPTLDDWGMRDGVEIDIS
jgi:hypothetical protein